MIRNFLVKIFCGYLFRVNLIPRPSPRISWKNGNIMFNWFSGHGNFELKFLVINYFKTDYSLRPK